MVKTLGKHALKQQEAIPLLHDGPLFRLVEADASKQEGREKGATSSSSTTVALQILQTLATATIMTATATNDLSIRFLTNLWNASRIKDQLQLLQKFKVCKSISGSKLLLQVLGVVHRMTANYSSSAISRQFIIFS